MPNINLERLPVPFKVMVVVPPRVGGWWTSGHRDQAVRGEVHWFSEDVDTDVIPCILYEGDGPRLSGASSLSLELLAALVLLSLRALSAPLRSAGWAGGIVGQTDSLGSQYCVAKLYSAAEPGASIIRAMASRCCKWDIAPALQWESRDNNTWADDLSKGAVGGFDPSKRIRVNWADYRDIQVDFEGFSSSATAEGA